MSRYDRVATALISLLVLTGVMVGIMFLMWLGPRLRYRPKAYSFSLTEEGYGRGDHPAGFGRDSRAPGDPDLPMLEEPAGSELPGLVESDIAESLPSEGDIAAVVAEVGDVAFNPGVGTEHLGFGGTGGGQGGRGDSRPPGPLGDRPEVVPRWERWEIQYKSSSLESYSRQLDYFKIELAAVGRKPLVDYAWNLSQRKPDTRTGPPGKEKRLYLSWRSGTLKEYDRQLLVRAGIETQGRIVVQFYAPELESVLATLEAQNAAGRATEEVFRTVFGVRENGGRMEYYVSDQVFRPRPRF